MKNPSKPITGLAAASMLCLTAAGENLPAAAPGKPNIIFLFTDDQTIGALGCYGNKDILTPNLDRLASKGVRFTNHYNTTAICMASRASVMTGLHEYRHGCNWDHGDLQKRFMDASYPALLREAGYFTGFAGKIGFVLEEGGFEPLAKYFDVWAGGPSQTSYETAKNKGLEKYAEQFPHATRATGAWAQDFLKEAKASGKPFCMSISFKAPHDPQTPDPIDVKAYEGKSLTPQANYGLEKGKHLSAQAHSSRAAASFGQWADFNKAAGSYYALVTGVDAAVGMILDGLQKEGLADNTVIIFTSDNGYSCGSHGFGDKVLPYEESAKAPLIIYDPRLPADSAGKVSDALTANVDMSATMCALANVPIGDIDGKSLLPLLAEPSGKVREHLPLFNFWGVRSARSMAVVTPDWKYIYWYYSGENFVPTEELFHLAKDRVEMTNAAKDPAHAPQLDELRGLYAQELAAMEATHMKGHSYEPFSVLFDQNVAWDKKADLVAALPSNYEHTANNPEAKANREKKAAQRAAKRAGEGAVFPLDD